MDKELQIMKEDFPTSPSSNIIQQEIQTKTLMINIPNVTQTPTSSSVNNASNHIKYTPVLPFKEKGQSLSFNGIQVRSGLHVSSHVLSPKLNSNCQEISPYHVKTLDQGTLCFSSPSFQPYRHNVFARALDVCDTGQVSPRKTSEVFQINQEQPRQVPYPGSAQIRRDILLTNVNEKMKQTIRSDSPVKQSIINSNNKPQELLKQNIRLSSKMTQSLSDQDNSRQIEPETLAYIMSNMSSPIKLASVEKIKIKKKSKPNEREKLNTKTTKINTKGKIKSDKQSNKIKNSKSSALIKSKKLEKRCKSSSHEASKEKTIVKNSLKSKTGTNSKSKVQKEDSDESLISNSKIWQKFSKIIQILTTSEQTKYKMCEIPVFVMNGTDENLLAVNSDETPGYVLCTGDDSIVAVMFNLIKADQYLMTFTDEIYQVKSIESKCLDEKEQEFVFKKAIFTTYLGSVTPPSAGKHIVIFSEFTDDCNSLKTDQRSTDVNTQQLAQIVSDVQLTWSDDDRSANDPLTRPKCDHPIFKAMIRILKSKRKENLSHETSEINLPQKKQKFQMRVVFKESSKPLLKERSKSKRKRKVKHVQNCTEKCDVQNCTEKYDVQNCTEKCDVQNCTEKCDDQGKKVQCEV